MDITLLPTCRYEAALAFLLSEGFCTLQVDVAEEHGLGHVPFEAVLAGISDAASRHPALAGARDFIASEIGWDGAEGAGHPAARTLSAMFDAAAADTRLYRDRGRRWMDGTVEGLDRSVARARSGAEAGPGAYPSRGP